ncbi:MAG: hypothetical protein RLZZ46_233 [Bacteroidota bacterium]|jgi:3-deoxy-D-manno-octulosonic-acid transferase
MPVIYTLLIRLYTGLIYFASLFSPKAKLWVRGRKQFPEFTPSSSTRWWFHCASLGEFEQARPVLESVKKQCPDIEIMLSFFSPSGYEIRKNYAFANKVFYLPADLPDSMQRLVNNMKPDAFFLVKYEFWLNLLQVLQKEKIPCYLFSAVFRKGHWLFSPAGFLAVKALQTFNTIWVQDAESLKRLKQAGFENAQLGGDTRFDRVKELPLQTFPEREKIRALASEKKILVAGSVWTQELQHLLKFARHKDFSANWKLILAPHEPSSLLIQSLKDKFSLCGKIGLWSKRQLDADILIVDTIGELGKIYSVADIALVGGGFGKGIHNILEPAVYGIPVFFGPRCYKALEAHGLLKVGGAIIYRNASDLQDKLFALVTQHGALEESGLAAASFVSSGSGATAALMNSIFPKVC